MKIKNLLYLIISLNTSLMSFGQEKDLNLIVTVPNESDEVYININSNVNSIIKNEKILLNRRSKYERTLNQTFSYPLNFKFINSDSDSEGITLEAVNHFNTSRIDYPLKDTLKLNITIWHDRLLSKRKYLKSIIDKPKNVSKIKVLNMATFHMRYTPDANKTSFNNLDLSNLKVLKEIAQQISEFKPTIIAIESNPEEDSHYQNLYSEYIKNPNIKFDSPSEIELLAFEVGKLSNIKADKIFGINNPLAYNYSLGSLIDNNSIDSLTYNTFIKFPEIYYPIIEEFNDENVNSDNLKNNLIKSNQPESLNYIMQTNADILTYVATRNNFEGADEAAKYYQRNLRMFSNLNRIHVNENDRVFILMGSSHTAFFNDFLQRSPKYELIEINKFLK
ncbi:DUF5694 domain-containing protein [Flavobacterium sp. W22_SRS_FP1]|uniref:DUF5694 domain-containing protein n=1 Tax=Flavobacterium sp. W22_SRS_FP1 TaxID=3240276 RepID=UPI003F8D9C97